MNNNVLMGNLSPRIARENQINFSKTKKLLVFALLTIGLTIANASSYAYWVEGQATFALGRVMF